LPLESRCARSRIARDCRDFVPAQRTTQLLMEAAERGGSIEAATEQFELALFLEDLYVRQ
jgi:hypothetical protein